MVTMPDGLGFGRVTEGERRFQRTPIPQKLLQQSHILPQIYESRGLASRSAKTRSCQLEFFPVRLQSFGGIAQVLCPGLFGDFGTQPVGNVLKEANRARPSARAR